MQHWNDRRLSASEREPHDREIRREGAWLEFGMTPPEWEDEANAPPVDTAELHALFRGELPDDRARRIESLIQHFRSWAEARLQIGAEEFRKGHN